jgi:hypothetical protein
MDDYIRMSEAVVIDMRKRITMLQHELAEFKTAAEYWEKLYWEHVRLTQHQDVIKEIMNYPKPVADDTE